MVNVVHIGQEPGRENVEIGFSNSEFSDRIEIEQLDQVKDTVPVLCFSGSPG